MSLIRNGNEARTSVITTHIIVAILETRFTSEIGIIENESDKQARSILYNETKGVIYVIALRFQIRLKFLDTWYFGQRNVEKQGMLEILFGIEQCRSHLCWRW